MIELESKIRDRSARVAVIGLGYVGLPLAVAMAKAGFVVTGIDASETKIEHLRNGKNYIRDLDDQEVTGLILKKKLVPTTDFSCLRHCDCVSVCVPTPLGKGKNPDMSFILAAITQLKTYLHVGQLIILESTTYPGTTEEVVLPLLEETGLKGGRDFYLAFSPERIDPGNKQYNLKNTPKIVGGVTPACTEMAQIYYQAFVDEVPPVSSTRAAEMVKLLENTFRAVNIGLANEIAIMCNRLGIDTWEVVNAAASKPFGFMPFYPGPGLGGHCIPVDPHYLLWKLRALDYNARFIQLADEINSSMPRLVMEKIAEALNQKKKAVKGAEILILGVAYKKNIDDCRESPALDVIHLLREKGAHVSYSDPHIPRLEADGITMEAVEWSEGIERYDCVALLTDHSIFDMKKIVQNCRHLVDTRNATKGILGYSGKITKI